MAQISMTQAGGSDGSVQQSPLLGIASADTGTLAFDVALAYSCPGDTERRQLFVSIADTWRLEDATQIPSPVIMRIDVPIRQLQWLTPREAQCRHVAATRAPDAVDDAGNRYFRLRAEAAGYAMLSCMGAGGRTSAAEAAATLDVWLNCPAADAGEATEP
jgi:hypothetical protein